MELMVVSQMRRRPHQGIRLLRKKSKETTTLTARSTRECQSYSGV